MRPLYLAFVAALVAACGDNRAPQLQPIADQTAAVGVELAVELRATDPDGDALSFDFEAPGLPDLKTRPQRASISSFADGVAIFRWTPTAMDRSAEPYAFDFVVTDARGASSTETVQIAVSDSGAGTAPRFRRPLGTGTTLDLSKDSCVTVDILVEDQDSTQVTLAEEDPKIPGATLDQLGPFEGSWRWCPSKTQIDAQDRYMLTLSADDGAAKTRKGFLVVIRRPPVACPGAAPAIAHTAPMPQTTAQDLAITATITDDKGLKGSPLLFYSETAPGASPDLQKMIQTTMTRTTGTALNGTYTGTLPNPVASSPPGTKKTLHYLIVADDNDQSAGPNGPCDHSTTSPTFTVEVTAPQVAQGAGVCAPCTADAQCGGPDDHCIPVGNMGQTFCGRACGAGLPACPTGYTCSAGNVTSTGGLSARQCLPTVGYCGTPPMQCSDDAYEENDTRATAKALAAGNHTNLSLCGAPMTGASDDDWYVVPTSSIITATATFLLGADYCDVDMQLLDEKGNVTHRAYGVNVDTETISGCGRYLRVFTFDSAPIKPNLYDLSFAFMPDDALEPNDSKQQAKALSLTPGVPKSIPNLRVCPSNEDWNLTYLLAADKLTVDLKLASTTAGDLDLFLYDDAGAEVAKSTNVGDEHLEHTAGASGYYYVVVKGKTAAAENLYTLEATLTAP